MEGRVGEETFGYSRYLNQRFYRSPEWLKVRDYVLVRDNGCDLGIEGHLIYKQPLIHHINPIAKKDFETMSPFLIDPEFLITISLNTHNAVHYGDEELLPKGPIERRPNDTCPWKQ